MTDYRRAFTLIELLVVIAIIALLVTLLVPALQEAKRQAKVVVCATQLKNYAMGLVVYGYEDGSGKYPPHDEGGWGSTPKVWSSVSSIYQDAFPDKEESLTMFRDMICGGSFAMLWCPLHYNRPQGPTGWSGGDPDYPFLWYDGRFGQNYMGGFFRFANCAGVGFAESGNAQTDGPPVRVGSSKDALVCDIVESEPGLYVAAHMDEWAVPTDQAPAARRENSVGYGDGHVETHSQRSYIEGIYITWDGAHYVTRGPVIRELY